MRYGTSPKSAIGGGPGDFALPQDKDKPQPNNTFEPPGGRGPSLLPGGIESGKPVPSVPTKPAGMGSPFDSLQPPGIDSGPGLPDDADEFLAELVRRVVAGQISAEQVATVLYLLSQLNESEPEIGGPEGAGGMMGRGIPGGPGGMNGLGGAGGLNGMSGLGVPGGSGVPGGPPSQPPPTATPGQMRPPLRPMSGNPSLMR